MRPIPTFKHPCSRHRDTNAASWRDRSEAEADTIRIRDLPSSPSRIDLTTHATPRLEHHIHAPAEMAGRHPEFSPWLAQYHPLEEGHEQAGTVLRPVQGGEHGAQSARQAAPGTKTSQNHNTALQTPNNTQATVRAQYTHSTLLGSFNLPIVAARRRQG